MSVSTTEATLPYRRSWSVIDSAADRIIVIELADHTSLAGLGETAAMMADEVKNPLAGVRGAIQVSR